MTSIQDQLFPGLPTIFKSIESFLMVTHTDHDGLISYTNKNFLTASEWTPKRVLGKPFHKMFPDTEQGINQANEIWEQMLRGKSWIGKVEKATKKGDAYIVNMMAIPLMANGETTSAVFIEQDITEDVEMQNQLKRIAFIDHETGLMSPHQLECVVNEYIASQHSFSFVYISIDHFYTLKDLQTNDSEKELILSFTNRLKRFFRDNAIARMNISEFVVLSPFADWYVQGFLSFLQQNPIYVDNRAIHVSVSGSIVRCPEDQGTYTHLMKAALATMKEVSTQGGGKIIALSNATHKILNRRAIIDQKLMTADLREYLSIVYQPQIDVKTGEVILYEALVRWEDDELGVILPNELIPIAEENGLIHEIGDFVLEEAAKLAVQWQKEGHPYKISINSSVREFRNPNFQKSVLDILKETDCPASLLDIEITEKFAFEAEEEISVFNQMKELQDLGIEFTLDDYGTGFASLRYMHLLPITKIKIDKFFIQSLTTQTKSKQLVEGMIRFGQSMGFTVIAEGVETEEQLKLLTSLGVDAVQGYYFGLPLSKEKMDFYHSEQE